MNIYFDISVTDITTKSPVPHHVDSRFKRARCISNSSTDSNERRNAFLSKRTERLVQQSAHGKEVSMRAAARDNEERKNLMLSIQNDLEMAEQLRTDKINAVKTSNGAVVQRAKEVALRVAEREEKEREALILQIEKQQHITNIRRVALKSIPRSKILDKESWAFFESEQVKHEAAITIQSWFRRVKLEPIVRVYAKFNMTRQALHALGFEKLMQKLQIQPIIKTIGLFLIRSKKSALKTVDLSSWKNPGRVFLSSYMMTLYPVETLQSDGPQEKVTLSLIQHLLNKALTVLKAFEKWLLTYGVKDARHFLDSFASFYAAFESWKNRDSLQVITDLVAHFMELEGLWLSVMHHEDADVEWAAPILLQQTEIINRLDSFGPAAVAQLAEAQNGTRAQVMVSDAPVDIHTEFIASPQVYRPQAQSIIIEPTMTIEKGQNDVFPETNQIMTESIPESPVPDMAEFGAYLSNEQLAHELVMDPNFALKAPKKTEMEERVQMIAKKAFGDAIREELSKGVYTNHVMGLLMDIKKGLLGMVSETGPVAKNINESLDESFIMHEMTHSAFNLEKTLQYMGLKMLELCAPIRDASVRALRQESDAAIIMMQMVDLLESMQLDLSNYRLQSIRPHLMRQAVEYERAKFDRAVESKQVELVKTTAWLASSIAQLQKIADERNPEGIEHEDLKVKYIDALNHGYLDLLFGKESINLQDAPETLSMDAKRLFDMQNEIQAIAIVAALCMLTKNLLSCFRNDEAAIKELRESFFILLDHEGTNVESLATQIVKVANNSFKRKAETMSSLSTHTSTPSQHECEQVSAEQMALIQSMVSKTVSFKDPLFNLLNRRVQSVVRIHLERDVFRNETLKRHGLDVVERELETLSTRIVSLVAHNKKVHFAHYNKILESLI